MARKLTTADLRELRDYVRKMETVARVPAGRVILGIVWKHLGWRSPQVVAAAMLDMVLRRSPDIRGCPAAAVRKFAMLAAIYRRTCQSSGQERAEGLARELILKLGLLEWLRVLPRDAVRRMDAAGLMEHFRVEVKPVMGAGSEDEYEVRGNAEMRLTVRRCMLVQIFEALGIAELAPYLCQTDTIYLGDLAPEIAFTHDGIISEGAERCLFRLVFAHCAGGDAGSKERLRATEESRHSSMNAA